MIYLNTFSKSLTPSIRISYMVLPRTLVGKFQENLGFYACTVSNFEQYTLAAFCSRATLKSISTVCAILQEPPKSGHCQIKGKPSVADGIHL